MKKGKNSVKFLFISYNILKWIVNLTFFVNYANISYVMAHYSSQFNLL